MTGGVFQTLLFPPDCLSAKDVNSDFFLKNQFESEVLELKLYSLKVMTMKQHVLEAVGKIVFSSYQVLTVETLKMVYLK